MDRACSEGRLVPEGRDGLGPAENFFVEDREFGWLASWLAVQVTGLLPNWLAETTSWARCMEAYQFDKCQLYEG